MLFTTLLFLVNTEKKAKDSAEKDIKTFDLRRIELKNKVSSSDLFLIKCGSNVCTLMDKNRKTYLEDTKNIVFSVQQINTKK